MNQEIFVFGSNLRGYHGAGSAYVAHRRHGAQPGIGVGLWGNSYAIPTKNCTLDVLTLVVINYYVQQFKEFAKSRPDLTFNIVAIGCGFAGYTPEQIAPMFKDCPDNCNLPEEFKL